MNYTPSLKHLIHLLKILPPSAETELGQLLRAESPSDQRRIRDAVHQFTSQLSEISQDRMTELLMIEFEKALSFQSRQESELIYMPLEKIIRKYNLDFASITDTREQILSENGDCLPFPPVSKEELDAELDQMDEERNRYWTAKRNIFSKIHF